MRDYALIFSALLLMGAKAPSPRIVSTSLCGDTYVLEKTPHDQIAALSWQSGDALSLAPLELQNLPKANDDIEYLLALNPTLVVFGPGEGLKAGPVLKKAGIDTLQIGWGESLADVNANRQKLANTLGYQIDNEDLNTPMYINPPRVLYLSRAGGTAGPGTYVNAAIEAAGGLNIIKTKGWHTPDPEMLAGLHPDLIITSFFDHGYESINATGLRHRLVQEKLNKTPHVNVPGGLWPCAGPGLSTATRIITNAIDGLPK
jgi:iron complex transport system substrate-binding protein